MIKGSRRIDRLWSRVCFPHVGRIMVIASEDLLVTDAAACQMLSIQSSTRSLPLSKTLELCAEDGHDVVDIIKAIDARQTFGTVNFVTRGQYLTIVLHHTNIREPHHRKPNTSLLVGYLLAQGLPIHANILPPLLPSRLKRKRSISSTTWNESEGYIPSRYVKRKPATARKYLLYSHNPSSSPPSASIKAVNIRTDPFRSDVHDIYTPTRESHLFPDPQRLQNDQAAVGAGEFCQRRVPEAFYPLQRQSPRREMKRQQNPRRLVVSSRSKWQRIKGPKKKKPKRIVRAIAVCDPYNSTPVPAIVIKWRRCSK